MRICVDPGHGGRDPGAIVNTAHEADITLDFARVLRGELQRRGHSVVLTREEDCDLAPGMRWPAGKVQDMRRRCVTANAFGADCFISLHANANARAEANGAWVIHAKGSARGEQLAQATFAELRKIAGLEDGDAAAEVYPDDSPWVGNRTLYVLRGTRMPAVLVELGFLTNPGDLKQLGAVQTRHDVARAIADGIERWWTEG